MTAKKAAVVDLSLIDLDSAAIAAICNLFVALLKSTPPEELARFHKRVDRIATFIEEDIFRLPPLE